MEVNGIEQVDPATAQQRILQGAVMVDVREADERGQARIPGTIALPLSVLTERWQDLPIDRPLIIQCAAGARSQHAAQFLAAHGCRTANLMHGLGGWFRVGLPIDTDPER
jgi:phage shock protein E